MPYAPKSHPLASHILNAHTPQPRHPSYTRIPSLTPSVTYTHTQSPVAPPPPPPPPSDHNDCNSDDGSSGSSFADFVTNLNVRLGGRRRHSMISTAESITSAYSVRHRRDKAGISGDITDMIAALVMPPRYR